MEKELQGKRDEHTDRMNQERLAIRRISKCTIKPRHIVEESQQPWYLTKWDLQLLPVGYIETGLLFSKCDHIPIRTIMDQLKDSLSTTLTLFYPLSGRLVTDKNLDTPTPSNIVSVDCRDGPGAEFVHAVADATTVSDIISPIYVPRALVESLFALDRPMSRDGHTLPLLSVQVTELADGYFVGCSCNHVVADGRSFWHFVNAWSEVSRSGEQNVQCISRPPVTTHCEQKGVTYEPFAQPEESTGSYTPQPYIERVFHFSSQSIQKLKAKSNTDLSTDTLSSFHALAALVWRSMTRARGLLVEEKTTCLFPIDMRLRLDPSLPREYFGNCASFPYVTTTAGNLVTNSLGWCASILHKKINEYSNKKDPPVFQPGQHGDPGAIVMFAMSPKFDMYNNDFGWGAPVAVRSGYAIKFDGTVRWYPGPEGGGSINLEICLSPKAMSALELDDEFIDVVSSSYS